MFTLLKCYTYLHVLFEAYTTFSSYINDSHNKQFIKENLYLTFLDKFDGLATLDLWYLTQSPDSCVAINPIFLKVKVNNYTIFKYKRITHYGVFNFRLKL